MALTKEFLLRMSPELHSDLQRVAGETERSINWLLLRGVKLLVEEFDRTGMLR